MYDKMLQRHKEGREFHLTKKLWRSKLEKRGRLPPESAPTPDTNNFITPQVSPSVLPVPLSILSYRTPAGKPQAHGMYFLCLRGRFLISPR